MQWTVKGNPPWARANGLEIGKKFVMAMEVRTSTAIASLRFDIQTIEMTVQILRKLSAATQALDQE